MKTGSEILAVKLFRCEITNCCILPCHIKKIMRRFGGQLCIYLHEFTLVLIQVSGKESYLLLMGTRFKHAKTFNTFIRVLQNVCEPYTNERISVCWNGLLFL